jgi:hypothetical protein
MIVNTFFLTSSSAILGGNDGSTLVYCCLPDYLPNVSASTPENIIEDENWTQLVYTQSGANGGASNCYFANVNTPTEANANITNLYIAINDATYSTIVKGVNVWVVNSSTNTITEKIVDNKDIGVYFSKKLNKFVLNIENNKTYDYPVYFVVQATREGTTGIAYSTGAEATNYLGTEEVQIGQTITPNNKIVAEIAVYTKQD